MHPRLGTHEIMIEETLKGSLVLTTTGESVLVGIGICSYRYFVGPERKEQFCFRLALTHYFIMETVV